MKFEIRAPCVHCVGRLGTNGFSITYPLVKIRSHSLTWGCKPQVIRRTGIFWILHGGGGKWQPHLTPWLRLYYSNNTFLGSQLTHICYKASQLHSSHLPSSHFDLDFNWIFRSFYFTSDIWIKVLLSLHLFGIGLRGFLMTHWNRSRIVTSRECAFVPDKSYSAVLAGYPHWSYVDFPNIRGILYLGCQV